MPHVSDFTKDEDQIVFDLINYDNSSTFTPAEITLGSAIPLDGKVNMTLTAVPGSGYGATVDVQYSRIKINEFFDLFFPQGLTLQQGDALTMGDLLPEINTGLGAAIPLSSIFDTEIGAWEGEPNEVKTLTLIIQPTSRVYEGQVTFTLDGNDIPLDSAISTKMLTGLNLPQLAPPKTPLADLFTSYVLDGF